MKDMPNRKNPPHVLATLICLVLVLGLNGSCFVITNDGKVESLADFALSIFSICTAGTSITCTDTTGENTSVRL